MELTDKNYNRMVKQSKDPLFIDFYSPRCGPCQNLGQFIDKRLLQYAEQNGVKVLKCDISKNPKIAEKFAIREVPFTMGVTVEKEIIHPETGLRDEGYYFRLVDKLAGKESFIQSVLRKIGIVKKNR